MSDFESVSGRTATAADWVDGQLIMPFYIICDVSASMQSDMDSLHAALASMVAEIASDPVVNDLAMLSVITFASNANTIVPLQEPSLITLPALIAGGGTNYGAAFQEYNRAFETDRARLKSKGAKVYRPCVFFLTDGAPGDRDYLDTFRYLLSYDGETRQGNKAYPYWITFGFRDAPEHIIRSLAYPDFGPTKGRWFLANTTRVGELLGSVAAAIGNTVISSSASSYAGLPQIILPTMPESHAFKFGEGDNFV